METTLDLLRVTERSIGIFRQQKKRETRVTIPTLARQAKPEFLTLGFIDYLDFGFDLSITSMIMLLTGIKDDAGIWLLLISFLLVMITSILVNRLGWNRETKQQKFLGVILPDIVGIVLLVISTLYMGGVIK